MHFKIHYLLYAPLLIFGLCNAQAFSTKETKVILVLEVNSNGISDMILFTKYQKMNEKQLLAEYPLSDFYLGILDGNYEVNGNEITPGTNTRIIMYTEKLLNPGVYLSIEESMIPGSRFDFGKIKAKIVSAKQDELIIKI